MDPVATSAGSGSTATAVAPEYPQATLASSPFPARQLGAGLLLAVIAVAALVLARRRRQGPRMIEIVESASLGPKRSLVVARLGDELLVLGSSEGGITLLSTRPAPAAVAPAHASAAEPPRAVPEQRVEATSVRNLIAKLRLGRQPAPPQTFEALLAESDEDVELRRKLAAGRAGSVP